MRFRSTKPKYSANVSRQQQQQRLGLLWRMSTDSRTIRDPGGAQLAREPPYRKKLRLLVQSNAKTANSLDTRDLTLAELANSFRDAVSERLEDGVEDWIRDLNLVYHDVALRQNGLISLDELQQVLQNLFAMPMELESCSKLFDTLDNGRQGLISFEQCLEFISAQQRETDRLTVPCTNVVTCVVISEDCSMIAFGGVGFAQVVDVADHTNIIFRKKYKQAVTAVALDGRGQFFYVGTFRSEGRNDADVDEFDLESDELKHEELYEKSSSALLPRRKFAYPNDVHCALVSNDNALLVIGGAAKAVWLYDRLKNDATPQVLIEIPYPTTVMAIAFARPMALVAALPMTVARALSAFGGTSEDMVNVEVQDLPIHSHPTPSNRGSSTSNRFETVTTPRNTLSSAGSQSRTSMDHSANGRPGVDSRQFSRGQNDTRPGLESRQRSRFSLDNPFAAAARANPMSSALFGAREVHEQYPFEITLDAKYIVCVEVNDSNLTDDGEVMAYALLNGAESGTLTWDIIKRHLGGAEAPSQSELVGKPRPPWQDNESDVASDITDSTLPSVAGTQPSVTGYTRRRSERLSLDDFRAKPRVRLAQPSQIRVGQRCEVLLVGHIARELGPPNSPYATVIEIMDDSGAYFDIDVTVFHVALTREWSPRGHERPDIHTGCHTVRESAADSIRDVVDDVGRHPLATDPNNEESVRMAHATFRPGEQVIVTAPLGRIRSCDFNNVLAMGGEGPVILSMFSARDKDSPEQRRRSETVISRAAGCCCFLDACVCLSVPSHTRSRSLNPKGQLVPQTSTSDLLAPTTETSGRMSPPSSSATYEPRKLSAAAEAVMLALKAGTDYLPKRKISSAQPDSDTNLQSQDKSMEVHMYELPMDHAVNALSLSADGQVLAIGGASQEVLIVNTTRHHQEVVQRFHSKGVVFGVSLSSDGEMIGIASAHRTVDVLNVYTGCQVFQVHCNDRVRAVALNDKLVACGGFDKHVRFCNTESGVTMHALPVKDLVRGVAFSADSSRLAMGGDDKVCRVYDTETRLCIKSWVHTHKVWAVALSHDGSMLATGDYDGWFIVRSVDSDKTFFKYRFEGHGGPPFIWSVAISADASRVAAGCWNKQVRVWSTKTWELVCPVLWREDRVFSIALANNGSLLAVGDRAGRASLFVLKEQAKPVMRQRVSMHDLLAAAKDGNLSFRLRPDSEGGSFRSPRRSGGGGSFTREDSDSKPTKSGPKFELTAESILEIDFPNRVYTVAVSEDGTLFALGGVHTEIWVFEITSTGGRRLQCLPCNGLVLSLDFTRDGSCLAAGGEDKAVTVWDCRKHFECLFTMPRAQTVHCVNFSYNSLAFAVGTKAILYGDGGHYRFSFRDRPDFEVAADVLDSRAATRAMLRQFPSVVNSCNGLTGESLMQRSVRLHNNKILSDLLHCPSNQRFGLIQDNAGNTAFKMALMIEKRKSAQMLLNAVVEGRLSTMPASLAGIVECFPLLNRTFPELLLDLVCAMPLEREPELLNQGTSPLYTNETHSVFALMPRGQKMLVRGSQLRTEPKWLWKDVLDVDIHREPNFLTELSLTNHTREEVQALRVPFRGFVDFYADCTQSPLHIITNAATKLNRLDVFEAPIVQAAIQFKWQSYARFLFMRQFFRFVVMLMVYLVFSISAARTVDGPLNPLEFWDYDHPATPSALTYARITLVLWPVCTLDGTLMIKQELTEMSRGVVAYLSSAWNILDLAAFSLQVAADFAWLFRTRNELVRSLLAVSMLLLFSRTMYFARGFEAWGPLVRMITQICIDIRPFLLVLLIFLCGFSSAFYIINSDRSEGEVPTTQYQNSWWGTLLFTVDSSVFNIVDRSDTPLFTDQINCADADDGSCEQENPYGDLRKGTLLYLFEFMMFIVQVMLLNLLIAIMGDSYGKVHQYAKLEAISERAKIILEAEVYWLKLSTNSRNSRTNRWTGPLVSLFFSDGGYVSKKDFAVWLHILQSGSDDAETDTTSNDFEANDGIRNRGGSGGRKALERGQEWDEEKQEAASSKQASSDGASLDALQQWLTQQQARVDSRLNRIAEHQHELHDQMEELVQAVNMLSAASLTSHGAPPSVTASATPSLGMRID